MEDLIRPASVRRQGVRTVAGEAKAGLMRSDAALVRKAADWCQAASEFDVRRRSRDDYGSIDQTRVFDVERLRALAAWIEKNVELDVDTTAGALARHIRTGGGPTESQASASLRVQAEVWDLIERLQHRSK
jgi:hypothetical protein